MGQDAIVQQAGLTGIKRSTRLNTSNVPDNMTHADMALCEQLDLPWPWPAPVHWAIPSPVSEALANAYALSETPSNDKNGGLISISRGIL